jgi:hypothetical protein
MNQLVRRRLLRAPVLQTWRLVTTGRKSKKFSVDRSGLVSFTEEEVVESDTPTASSKVTKESLSPLAKDLQSYIKLKGPISLHDYMAQSLNHLVHGYYQGKHMSTNLVCSTLSEKQLTVYIHFHQGREKLLEKKVTSLQPPR